MGSDMAPKASFSNLDEEKMGLEKSVYLVLSELLITKRRWTMWSEKDGENTEKLKENDKWLWLRWQRGHFKHQRSLVRIQSSAIFKEYLQRKTE